MSMFKTWGVMALLASASGFYPNDIPLQPLPGTPPDAYAPEPVPLREPVPVEGHRFGAAVAGSGQRLVVGAPGTGVAYLFDADTGASSAQLHDPDAASANDFGAAVATTNGTLAVGAPGSTAVADGGAVHVFEPSGALRRTLVNPADRTGDRFGTSIAFTASERMLVGAPAAGTGRSGAAYLFGSSGELLATLASPNPSAGDGFGATVAVVGSTALVAAPFDDTTTTDAGAVYVFDVFPGSASFGAFVRRLQKPTPGSGDGFGAALAVTARTIFVGAPFDDGVAPDAGAVYLFAADDGESLGVLPGSSPEAGDGFGTALAVIDFVDPAVGALLAVGAPSADADGTSILESGAVHLFVHPAEATDANPTRVITRPGAAAFDAFGYTLTFSGNGGALAVGIPGDGAAAGAALRYLPTCGDSNLQDGEQCDDDGNLDGDGCSGQCLNEPCSCGGECDGAEVARAAGRLAALTNGGVCDCAATAGNDCSESVPGGTGDGLTCTTNERCTAKAGLCVGTTLHHDACADDGNPCTVARCDPLGPAPTGCVHDQVSCDDADPCTEDTCDPLSGCQNIPRDCTCDVDADCDDGNTCNGREGCFECPLCVVTDRFGCCDRPATCSGGTPPPLGAPCDDGDACNVEDRCDAQLRCTGQSLPGNTFVTVGCVLQRTPCPENAPTKRLRRRHARALVLVQRAATNPTDALIRRAINKITRAIAAANAAGARGKLPPECVGLWVALLNDALALLQST
jgi:cysteine-rich repeat protein